MVSPDCEGSPQSDIANYDVDARPLATDLAYRNGPSLVRGCHAGRRDWQGRRRWAARMAGVMWTLMKGTP